MVLSKPNIEQAISNYTLPDLHLDLLPYLHDDELHHPLVTIEGGVQPRIYPRLNQLYQYKQKQSQKNWVPNEWQAYFPHLPSWERIRKFMTEELARPDFPKRDPAYYEFLGQIWTDPEEFFHTSSFLELMLGVMGNLPLSEHVHHMMTPAEQQKLAKLPDEFVVFRGHADPLLQGISWTLKLDIALQYAVGSPLQSSVSVGRVRRRDAIASINRWHEDEVIVPTRAVKDIETYSVGRDKDRPWERKEPANE